MSEQSYFWMGTLRSGSVCSDLFKLITGQDLGDYCTTTDAGNMWRDRSSTVLMRTLWSGPGESGRKDNCVSERKMIESFLNSFHISIWRSKKRQLRHNKHLCFRKRVVVFSFYSFAFGYECP